MMSDLSNLLKVIDKIDVARLGAMEDASSDLKRRALDFYASQGVEVDPRVLESVCASVACERPALPHDPAPLPMNASEKRWRAGLFLSGAFVLATGFAVSLAELEHWSLAAALIAPFVGMPLLFLGIEVPAFWRWCRRDDAYLALLKSASVQDLLLLRRNPKLNSKRAQEVDSELYSRGLSANGESLLS